jgi:hypothetical protein
VADRAPVCAHVLVEQGDVFALGVASKKRDLEAYVSDQMFLGLSPAVGDFPLRASPLEDISICVAQAVK